MGPILKNSSFDKWLFEGEKGDLQNIENRVDDSTLFIFQRGQEERSDILINLLSAVILVKILIRSFQ